MRPARFEDHSSGVMLTSRTHHLAADLILARYKAVASSLNGRFQSVGCEGLEKIVQCVTFEGSNCPFVIGGHKYDLRQLAPWIGGEGADCVEAIHIRHAYVEEKKIRIGQPDEVDCFTGRTAFAHDVNVRDLLKELTDLLAGQHFIVCEDCANHRVPNLAMGLKESGEY